MFKFVVRCPVGLCTICTSLKFQPGFCIACLSFPRTALRSSHRLRFHWVRRCSDLIHRWCSQRIAAMLEWDQWCAEYPSFLDLVAHFHLGNSATLHLPIRFWLRDTDLRSLLERLVCVSISAWVPFEKQFSWVSCRITAQRRSCSGILWYLQSVDLPRLGNLFVGDSNLEFSVFFFVKFISVIIFWITKKWHTIFLCVCFYLLGGLSFIHLLQTIIFWGCACASMIYVSFLELQHQWTQMFQIELKQMVFTIIFKHQNKEWRPLVLFLSKTECVSMRMK